MMMTTSGSASGGRRARAAPAAAPTRAGPVAADYTVRRSPTPSGTAHTVRHLTNIVRHPPDVPLEATDGIVRAHPVRRAGGLPAHGRRPAGDGRRA
ncbi:exported hypothetical protein [Frankia sp. Hr75.2]|nr:exported hypothetical protein [Frankia sp. Hr75.2]